MNRYQDDLDEIHAKFNAIRHPLNVVVEKLEALDVLLYATADNVTPGLVTNRKIIPINDKVYGECMKPLTQEELLRAKSVCKRYGELLTEYRGCLHDAVALYRAYSPDIDYASACSKIETMFLTNKKIDFTWSIAQVVSRS